MNSHRTMLGLTIGGVAIAVATLLTTMAIVDGFGAAYERALLSFGAHIVIMRETEFAQPDEHAHLRELVEAGLSAPGQTAPLSARHLTRWRDWGAWGIGRYGELQVRCREWPVIGSLLTILDPVPLVHSVLAADRIPVMVWQAIRHSLLIAGRGVTAAAPFLYREGLLVGAGQIRGVVVKGVPPEAMSDVWPVRLIGVESGALSAVLGSPAAGEPLPVLIGNAFGVAVDTELKLFLPRAGKEGASPTRDFVSARVVGLFESGLHDYDSQFILVGLPALQKALGLSDRITGVELRLDDPAKAPWVASQLSQRASADITVLPWQEMHRSLFEAIGVERLLFGLIMGILVIVAAVNLLSTVCLHLLKEYRSVAVLRAIGLSGRQARRRYFWEAMRTSGYGVGLGALLGGGLVWSLIRWRWIPIPAEVYFLSHLPVTISRVSFGCVLGFAVLVCAAAARHAARKVSELPLLEGLGRSH
ncbi:MAG: ABC transporter permease [Deltaproteobacteria bacterium]|nr:ABC transporter permease [Deltaproteobacteria bacterium]